MCKLLEKDPAKRMTAEDAARHEWMCIKDGHLASNNLVNNIRKIQLCNIGKKLRAAVDVVSEWLSGRGVACMVQIGSILHVIFIGQHIREIIRFWL